MKSMFWTNEKLSLMVITSFHFLLQSFFFFYSGNSIVSGGNLWCAYQNTKYRSNHKVLVFYPKQHRIYNLVPFSLPTFPFFLQIASVFWTVFWYAALSLLLMPRSRISRKTIRLFVLLFMLSLFFVCVIIFFSIFLCFVCLCGALSPAHI